MTPDPAEPTSPAGGPSPAAVPPPTLSVPSTAPVASGTGQGTGAQAGRGERSPWASSDTVTEVFALPLNGSRPMQEPPETWPAPFSRRRVAVIVGSIVVFVVLSAIGTALAVMHSGTMDSLPPVSQPTAATDPAPNPSPTGIYRAPQDLCEQADFTRLRPTFYTLDSLSSHGSVTPVLSVSGCDGATGNATVNGTFAFEVQVSGDPSAMAGVFEEDQAAAVAHSPVTPISGLGTRAYSYTESGAVGLTVKVYDANMIMKLSWTPENRRDAIPAGLSDTLIATCRANLPLLRQP